MATHSSTLAFKIPWMEELGAGYYPWVCKESGTTEQLHTLSLSAIRVVSSAYLRLLIFLLAILIPAFLMMYSAYKLNKHGDNIQP